jgi:hypothetical protein
MRSWLLLGIGALLALAWGPPAQACEMLPDMPPRVAPFRELAYSTEHYAQLTKDWGAYVDKHPKVAIGYVFLWRAQRSTPGSHPDGLHILQKAYEIDPNCAQVLSELGDYYLQFGLKPQAGEAGMEEVRRLSRRAIELAPDSYEPHFNLMRCAVRSGDEAEARVQLQAMLHKGAFPSPLLDYCYNMLMSADPDAIVLTNGDNDTFPAWALQTRYGVRSDVRVIDLSILTLPMYVKATLVGSKNRPAPFTEVEIADVQREAEAAHTWPGPVILTHLTQKVGRGEWKSPVYIATTVPHDMLEAHCSQTLEIEGLVYHVLPGPPAAPGAALSMNRAKTDSLLTKVYRLESAMDFGYPWSADSPISSLMMNYVGAWARTAHHYADAGDLDGVRRMLRGALGMLRFHRELRHSGDRDMPAQFLDYWKKVDPHNPEVEKWRREFES